MKQTSLAVTARFRVAFTIAILVALSWTRTDSATLPPTNNLVMWLKADTLSLANGASVAYWGDNSANSYNAVSLPGWNAPTFATNGINGRPGVYFGNSTIDALHVTNGPGISGTVLLPAGFTFAGAFKTFSSASLAPNGGNAANSLLDDKTGNDTIAFGVNGGLGNFQRYQNTFPSGWYTTPSSWAVNNTNYYPGHFMIASHNSSSGLAQLDADGIFQGSNSVSYNGATGFNIIGNRSGGQQFNGWIGELFVYSTDLSSADQLDLQKYLRDRWLEIPEPSALAMFTLAGVLLFRRRR